MAATAAKSVHPHITKNHDICSYYADHKGEIESDFTEDRRLADESERQRLKPLGQ